MSENKKKKKEKKTLSFRVDKALAKELDEFCEDYSIVKSAFISKAIERFLKEQRNNSKLF